MYLVLPTGSQSDYKKKQLYVMNKSKLERLNTKHVNLSDSSMIYLNPLKLRYLQQCNGVTRWSHAMESHKSYLIYKGLHQALEAIAV